MSDFEFVFALYSLLLGLSMVELLGGLGRAIEVRFAAEAAADAEAGKGKFAIGWLTPLLAVFVMLDLLSFWRAAWVAKERRGTRMGYRAVVIRPAAIAPPSPPSSPRAGH